MELFFAIFLSISIILVLHPLNLGCIASLTEVTCFGIIHLDILSREVP